MKSVIKSAKTVDEAVELGLRDLGLTRDSVDIEVLEESKSGFLGIFGSKDAIVKITEKIDFKIDINDIYGEKVEDKVETTKEKPYTQEKKVSENKEQRQKPVQKSEKRVERQENKTVVEKNRKPANKQSRPKFEEKIKNKPAPVEKKVEPKEVIKQAPVENTVKSVEDNQIKVSKEDLLLLVKENLEQLVNSMHIKAKVNASLEDETLAFNLVDISEEDTGIIIGRKGETLDSLQYILSLMANKNTSTFNRVTLDVANYRTRRKEAIENNARKVAYKVIKSRRSIALEPMNSYERRIVHYALQSYKEVETVSQGNFPNRKVVIKYKD